MAIKVLVEAGAGLGSGLIDEEYAAKRAPGWVSAAEAWGAEMVIKVKEPLESEYQYPAQGPAPVHLPPLGGRRIPDQGPCWKAATTAIAYETVKSADGTLPLLTPMSPRSQAAWPPR